jgi:putative colanic acid biosynthesis UDP-glucose lipid carrier transferase
MIWERLSGIRWLVLVQQITLAGILFWGLQDVFEHIGFTVPPDGLRQYAIYYVCVALGLLASGYLTSSWQHQLLDGDFVIANRQSMQQLALVCGFLAVYLVATKDIVISRFFLGIFLGLFYFMLLLSNRFLPGLTCRHLFSGARQENALIIGSIRGIENLMFWLEQKKRLGIHAVGICLREKTVEDVQDIPVLGTLENLETITRQHGITQVIVVNMQEFSDLVPRLMHLVETAGLRLLVQSNLEQLFKHSLIYLEDNGLQFVSLRQEPMENPLNRVFKRILDLAISGLVIGLILPPLTALIWIVQRFQSSGPLFYKQQRAGIQNITFSIYKFRSMHTDHGQVTRQATMDDERVYAFGRFMRRYSIDELPQFLNVWRGEMSVVGPRPHLAEHNDMFAKVMKNYHIRTYVKPGITGLAQVRGFRGEITRPSDIDHRLASDLYYIENWTVMLDLTIVLRTIWHVIFPPKQAY